MSKNKRRRKHRFIKRLKHHRQPLKNLPYNLINENLFNKSNYNKYFNYSLPELLADHSTDPNQNTVRQYILSNISNQGRFINHQMIIRKNGESTILRPKQDIVLVNGFTPIIRPSYLLSLDQSVPLHSQIASSSSIINKMSINKSKRKTKLEAQKVNKQVSVHNLSSNTLRVCLFIFNLIFKNRIFHFFIFRINHLYKN